MIKLAQDMTEAELLLVIARSERPGEYEYVPMPFGKSEEITVAVYFQNSRVGIFDYKWFHNDVWQRDKAAVLDGMASNEEEKLKAVSIIYFDNHKSSIPSSILDRYKSATLKDLAVMWVGWKHRDGCEV